MRIEREKKTRRRRLKSERKKQSRFHRRKRGRTMRRFPRLLPALLRGSCRGEGATCSGRESLVRSLVASPSEERRNWSSSVASRPRRPPPLLLLEDASSRCFFAARAAGAPPSTSTTTTTATAPPPTREPQKKRKRSRSSSRAPRNSSGTKTAAAARTRLDPLVLEAIAGTQRNSVSRALQLLAAPPAHVPLEHLTLAGNSLISALGRCGRPREALRALERLAELGAPFDSFTAAAAVSACSRAASKVGTLPRPWAEGGRAIYRGYIEAAEAAAAAAAEKEEEEEAAAEEEEAEVEEASGRRAGGGGPGGGATRGRRRRRREKARPIRDRPLLRALLDCGSRSMVRCFFFFLFGRAEKEQGERMKKKNSFFLSL